MLYRLEIHCGEGADVETHFFQSGWVKFFRFGSDSWFFAHDDLFGCGWVRREEAPVHVSPVAEVWVVGFFCGPFEDFGDEALAFGWALDEEFYGRGEEGELDFDGFVGEGVEEVVEEDVGVFDSVGVLADYPDHGGFCFWFVERVQMLA